MIRPAVASDIPRLVEMGLHFIRSTSYAQTLRENPAQMAKTATSVIAAQNGVVLVAEDSSGLVGMIGLMAFPHHLSGDLVAGELFWWQEPSARGAGVRLLKAAEAWAREQGALMLHMIAPTGQVGRVYQRLGYQSCEIAYQKELS